MPMSGTDGMSSCWVVSSIPDDDDDNATVFSVVGRVLVTHSHAEPEGNRRGGHELFTFPCVSSNRTSRPSCQQQLQQLTALSSSLAGSRWSPETA